MCLTVTAQLRFPWCIQVSTGLGSRWKECGTGKLILQWGSIGLEERHCTFVVDAHLLEWNNVTFSMCVCDGGGDAAFPFRKLLQAAARPQTVRSNICMCMRRIDWVRRGHRWRIQPKTWQATGCVPRTVSTVPTQTGEPLIFSHLRLLLTENHMEQ